MSEMPKIKIKDSQKCNNLIFEKVEVTEEYYIYTYTQFISDLGGNMGLFLGWSILSMIQWFMSKISEVCPQNVTMKNV